MPVRYFELRTLRGARRYSAEILLGPGDRIILDDDSVTNLEARTTCLVPATLYSRMLARRPRPPDASTRSAHATASDVAAALLSVLESQTSWVGEPTEPATSAAVPRPSAASRSAP